MPTRQARTLYRARTSSTTRAAPFVATRPEPGTLTQAIDISSSRLTASIAHAVWEQGYRLLIQGIRYRDLALTRTNIQIAMDEGLAVETYAYLWWGGDVVERVRQSVELSSALSVRRLWLDCEDDGNGDPGVPDRAVFPPSRIVDLIGRATDACGQFPRGQYSGAWWWVPATGDCRLWAGDEWWIASYDGAANLSVGRPFGGVEKPRGKQYQGTTSILGLSADLSVFAA